MKNKYYVVWKGHTPGVYDNWEACKKEVENFPGALYKGFPDKTSAEEAFAKGFSGFEKKVDCHASFRSARNDEQPINPLSPAIAVDAACSGNPGKMEYQGVFVDFGTEPATTTTLFKSPVFENGTNNIGEFLAIVLGLAYLKQNNLPWVLYSDSRTALTWLKKGHADTKLEWNAGNEDLFFMLRKAEQWLHDNTWTTPIYKWDTKQWGEIPADFGRK